MPPRVCCEQPEHRWGQESKPRTGETDARAARAMNSEQPAGNEPAGNQPAGNQPGGGSLTFPGVARLELDELLVQLVERAQEVMRTQNRMHGLLEANRAIASDLSLSDLLQRIVNVARDLVDARYAAGPRPCPVRPCRDGGLRL
jgi:two-component system, NarL family, sensor histidine kinase DevS